MRRLKRTLAMLLVLCMVATFLPVTAGALTIEGNTVTAKQFYPLTGSSGNGAWGFCGIVIDESNNVHLVLANENSNNKLDAETTLYVTYPDNPDESFCLGHDYPEPTDHLTPRGELTWKIVEGASFNLLLVDDEGNPIGQQAITANAGKGAQSYYFFEIGDMDIFKHGAFNIGLETKTGGLPGTNNAWDIGDPPEVGNPVEVHYEYGITKTVANDEDGDTVFENTAGECITYTVTIENKSVQSDGGTGILLPVKVDYVYDYVPEGLIVSLEDNPGYSFAKDEAGNDITNQLVLDTNVTLTPDGDTRTKTYTVVARIDPSFKGGVVKNIAVMGGDELVEKQDDEDVTIESYFYVHHIENDGKVGHENGVEQRMDKVKFTDALRSGTTFDVTTANSAGTDYKGMLLENLYGGTFYRSGDEGTYTYTEPYEFTTGENGIGFTPKVNEHYYVWEPTNRYLRPINLAVWHKTTSEGYHTVAGYPVSVVDRVYYQNFGVNVYPHPANPIYGNDGPFNKIVANAQFEYDKPLANLYELVATDLKLTGYVGCYKFPDTIFGDDIHAQFPVNAAPQTFLPYWVTMDGVQVTGYNQRTASYKGVGPTNGIDNTEDYRIFNVDDSEDTKYSVKPVAAPSAQPLMVSAMFRDNNLTHPAVPEAPDPMTVEVKFDPVCAGKSGNVKALNLTADLRAFEYDDSWFMINGERVNAEDQGDNIFAELDMKHFKNGDQITIVPCWLSGEEEVTGPELVLEVVKKTVTVAPEEPVAEPDEEEVVEETELVEEEYVEETEFVEESEDGSEEEYVEESDKKAEKEAKKAEKKAEKAEKKAKKESSEEVVEEPAEVIVEEITTVTFVRSTVVSAKAPVNQDMGTFGMILQ